MNALMQVQRVRENLAALGARRLIALGLVGVGVFLTVAFIGFYLSRPTTEMLYSGLDRDDIAGIGTALKEAGFSFDVNSEGTAVSVPLGQAALARMTLAEKGLPRGGGTGNELYEKIGSLGLTSFMQEVTHVRAIEGELARTIQMMHGVKAARVHIVLGDEGSFRREARQPSASVLIRSERDPSGLGRAIRHLVAGAISNMSPEAVTVLDVDGRSLAAGEEATDKGPESLLSLERSVAQDIRETISHTLSPYLGPNNFQLGVSARLNVDKKQLNETVYNPDQRVERSVRVTKESQNSHNAAGAPPASVEANIPKPKSPGGSETKQSTDQSQKREELTNYEISSKAITTTSSGFTIDRLSVAMLINRSALTASFGAKGEEEKVSTEAMEQQVRQIEQLVSSAAGLRSDRGDVVKISVVNFADGDRELAPAPGPTIPELLARQSGALINALAMIVVVAMAIWLGVRPVTRVLLSPAPAVAERAMGFPDALATSRIEPTFTEGVVSKPLLIETEPDEFLKELEAQRDASPLRRVEKLIDFDEERATMILKQWISKGTQA